MLQVFIHIPKTSGTTLREFLRPHFSNDEAIYWYGNEQFERNYPGIAPQLTDHTKIVFGHFFYGLHELTETPVQYHTLLRHPIDRMISFFEFTRQQSLETSDIPEVVRIAQSGDILQFFQHFPEVCNGQCLYLSPKQPESVGQALEHLQNSHFGLQSYAALYLKEVAEQLDIRPLRFRDRKVRKQQPIFDQATMGKLESLCAADLELYHKAEALYLARQHSSEPRLEFKNRWVNRLANWRYRLA
ncbi:sulfotransferase family protein [Oceanobacter mangrovi]|uniref:sulfotransferase family protein n=1 Tax=Oceanobacter mangrovi TaxID=2862510 RepID=UPI001C8EBFCA|nr:sulfotransferase family protein [Oceanobacter mangrovi]